MVCSPVGSGKTHWAFDYLSRTAFDYSHVLYLIDTNNGKDQLLKTVPHLTEQTDQGWINANSSTDRICDWSRDRHNIVIMTYAKFGALAEYNPNFGIGFDIIICDEIHNLIRFDYFGGYKEQGRYYLSARKRLERIVRSEYCDDEEDAAMVIGISATPDAAIEELDCRINIVPIDDDVRRLSERNTIPYRSVYQILPEIGQGKKGLIYVTHIRTMEKIVTYAEDLGLCAVAIWSINNFAHPMSAEQLAAREYILRNRALPPEYDCVIINASSETSISIDGEIDYIIV